MLVKQSIYGGLPRDGYYSIDVFKQLTLLPTSLDFFIAYIYIWIDQGDILHDYKVTASLPSIFKMLEG